MDDVRAARILQNFADVGQWLMQSAAPRHGWLDGGARTPSACDQAFVQQTAEVPCAP